MNKYPKKRQTNGYFAHICKSITAKRKIIRLKAKNRSAQNEEKQCGKKPKNVPKAGKEALKMVRKEPERTFRHTFGNIKKLPETPSRFTGTARHAPHPTELPAKRQPKPSFPYKQETAKPMRIVYFPPRPHSSPNERLSKGRNLLFDILPFPSPDGLLIH